jgi:hypothetical protein
VFIRLVVGQVALGAEAAAVPPPAAAAAGEAASRGGRRRPVKSPKALLQQLRTLTRLYAVNMDEVSPGQRRLQHPLVGAFLGCA